MPLSAFSTSSSPPAAAVPEDANPFGVTCDILHEFVSDTDHGLAVLQSLGGVKGLARKLHAHLNSGLRIPPSTPAAVMPAPKKCVGGSNSEGKDATHIAQRIAVFGENTLPEAGITTFWDFVRESLEDRMLQMLIASAMMSLCLGLLVPSPTTGLVDYAHGWVDGAAILFTVALVTVVGSGNNYQKELKFRQLNAKKPPKKVTVIRNGGLVEDLLDAELLVGDLLLVKGGDVLTVDGVVVRATQLKIDESTATGENEDVAKAAYSDHDDDDNAGDSSSCDGDDSNSNNNNNNGSEGKKSETRNGRRAAQPLCVSPAHRQGDCFIRSGTSVVEGEGTVLVTGVGIHSYAGRIAMAVRQEKEDTPLQEKLSVLADQIGYAGMAAAGLMFTILSAKEMYATRVAHAHQFNYRVYLDCMMTAITIVVVAVPEGLPLSVTIALAYSMQQMFREQSLVRHLAACETMGGVTTICSDKTGTLTLGDMTVTNGITGSGVAFVVPPLTAMKGGKDGQASAPPLLSPSAMGSPLSCADAPAKLFSDVLSNESPLRTMLMEGIAVNTTCTRKAVFDPATQQVTGHCLTGNKTEQALLGFVERLGADAFRLRADTLARVCDTVHVYCHNQQQQQQHGDRCEPSESDLTSSAASPTLDRCTPFPQGALATAAAATANASEPSSTPAAVASVASKEMRVYPFTSARKRMTTAMVLRPATGKSSSSSQQQQHQLEQQTGGTLRYHVKGASEIVLEQCRNLMKEDGSVVPLTAGQRARLEKGVISLARRRMRTLAIAYAEVDLAAAQEGSSIDESDAKKSRNRNKHHAHSTQHTQQRVVAVSGSGNKSGGSAILRPAGPAFVFPDTDDVLPSLTLLGIVGIHDPVRPEVPRATARCRQAGVTVRVVTGDSKATATAIAREAGIYGAVYTSVQAAPQGGGGCGGVMAGESGLALEGWQFRELARSSRALDAILPRLQVIARASPLDKQTLVAALMARGEVVAVTGDGTNDAPALRSASVGFAMNSGTEVAKMAADVVVLDDNFSTIVTAMKWGRNVNDNLRKFLQFQLTVNAAAVLVAFAGSLMDPVGESPLKPVQLLWVNLIMDTLAALALATESPSEDVLNRAPRPKDAPLITRRMWRNVIGQSLYQVIVQLWLLRHGHAYFGVPFHSEEHFSIVFNVFVLLQLFNEFNARVLDDTVNIFRGLDRAPLFMLVVGLCFVVQVVGVQYGGPVMCAVPLSWQAWQKCLQLAFVPIPLGLVLRCLVPVGEDTVTPPPIVVDTDEEHVMWKTVQQQQKKRPTLRAVARRVCVQLRVITALRAAADAAKADAADKQ